MLKYKQTRGQWRQLPDDSHNIADTLQRGHVATQPPTVRDIYVHWNMALDIQVIHMYAVELQLEFIIFTGDRIG
jgi:hypothetical protein